MLPSNLPYEILLKIAEHLSKDFSRQCALVCKSWTLPFQEVLWESLSIENTSQLRNICKLSIPAQSIVRTNGHLVRQMSLKFRLEISYQQLFVLQNCFQNLNYLHINCSILPTALSSNKINWKLWERLETLSVLQPKLFVTNGLHGFVSILSFYPKLKQLVVDENLGIQMATYTWKDLEIILQPLQHLQQLKINIAFGLRAIDNTPLSKDINPINSLVHLCVAVSNADHKWLYYFTEKAPRIHTLDLDIDFPDLRTCNQWSNMLGMITTMPSPFENLRTLQLKNCATSEYYVPFLDLLCRLKVPLTTLTYDMRRDFTTVQAVQSIVEKSGRLFSKTMENMNIISRFSASFKCTFPMCFYFFPCLVRLQLRQIKACIVLDDILNQCPALKDLILDQPCVTVSTRTRTSTAFSSHGLKTASLTNTNVNSKLFNYVSLRCRKLLKMRLENVKVFGHIEEGKENSFECDMSHTQIDSLFLYNVRYYALHNKDVLERNYRQNAHNMYQVKDATIISIMEFEPNKPEMDANADILQTTTKSPRFFNCSILYRSPNMTSRSCENNTKSQRKLHPVQYCVVWKYEYLKNYIVHGFEREIEES
ncbi:hypothetical protein F4703DRAFT_1819336 [Phycomyces blakesleeanus]